MQEQVKATFLVNAAVLLEFRGAKLLIDGIYDENGHCFSNLSVRQWEKLKAGEGEFAGIEYLLFTHEHGDHFSPQRVAEYLEYRQPKAIFMPRDGSAALRALQKKAEGMGIPCVLLHRELCRKTVFRPEQEIRIRAFQTRHLDKLYWDVPHFCYLLECGEKKLLFTADVDFTQEDIESNASGKITDNTAIAGVLNKYKNMFGKARVVVIKSQLGQPIVAYSGEDVYWEIPDDLPKFTKLMIDGKALYIHRANFQIIDKSLL